MDWEDQFGLETLKPLILEAASRELIEEWGRKHPEKPTIRIQAIAPIGYFRMPHRGGKPQFVVFAKLHNDDIDLRPDISEVTADLSESAAARFFVPDLKSLANSTTLMTNKASVYLNSVPLFGALVCLEHAIRLSPQVICNVAGYAWPTPGSVDANLG
jgi:hypothetical protein